MFSLGDGYTNNFKIFLYLSLNIDRGEFIYITLQNSYSCTLLSH